AARHPRLEFDLDPHGLAASEKIVAQAIPILHSEREGRNAARDRIGLSSEIPRQAEDGEHRGGAFRNRALVNAFTLRGLSRASRKRDAVDDNRLPVDVLP